MFVVKQVFRNAERLYGDLCILFPLFSTEVRLFSLAISLMLLMDYWCLKIFPFGFMHINVVLVRVECDMDGCLFIFVVCCAWIDIVCVCLLPCLHVLAWRGSQYPSIAEEIKSVASADPALRKLFVRGLAWNTTSETLCAVSELLLVDMYFVFSWLLLHMKWVMVAELIVKALVCFFFNFTWHIILVSW